MKSSTVLRWCLVIEWVFIPVVIAVDGIMQSSLPEPLRAWLKSEHNSTTFEVTCGSIVILLMVFMFVATVGLLCLRRWAAWLYLITFALGVVLLPFAGPTVGHALPDTLSKIMFVMSGMIIALSFFTDSLK